MHFDSLDEYDNQIINILMENARAGYSEIGDQIGLSRPAVKNRMRALEQQGYITGYHAAVNVEYAAENVMFLLDVETTPEQYMAVVTRLAQDKTIRKIYAMSGDCHILAVGTATNKKKLHAYFRLLYSNLAGVKRMVCHSVMDVLKDEDAGIVWNCEEPGAAKKGAPETKQRETQQDENHN